MLGIKLYCIRMSKYTVQIHMKQDRTVHREVININTDI